MNNICLIDAVDFESVIYRNHNTSVQIPGKLLTMSLNFPVITLKV